MRKQGILLSIVVVLLLSLWSLTSVGLPYGVFDWTAYSQPYVTETPTATIEPTITLTPTPTQVTTPTALVYLPLIRRSPEFRPVTGGVRILDRGRCCYRFDPLSVHVGFEAESPFAEVTEMRVRTIGIFGRLVELPRCTPEPEERMSEVPREPFVSTKTIQIQALPHFAIVEVHAQYRDALGYLSPVYCDARLYVFPTATAWPTATATPAAAGRSSTTGR